jgi:hypothetical protein
MSTTRRVPLRRTQFTRIGAAAMYAAFAMSRFSWARRCASAICSEASVSCGRSILMANMACCAARSALSRWMISRNAVRSVEPLKLTARHGDAESEPKRRESVSSSKTTVDAEAADHEGADDDACHVVLLLRFDSRSVAMVSFANDGSDQDDHWNLAHLRHRGSGGGGHHRDPRGHR